MPKTILALNPFHTGSHQAFIEGWKTHSQHQVSILSLPGHHWKWRMRHAANSFALQLQESFKDSNAVDLIWTTDMLNVAELKGLLPNSLRQVPVVLYFHENQFEYPSREDKVDPQRDLHFAFTNLISLMAADQIWFNSQFHRENLRQHVLKSLQRFPQLENEDHRRWHSRIEDAFRKSQVHSPGISQISAAEISSGPLHVAWVSRWEHDKNPEQFFGVLDSLKTLGVPFQLSVLGESYRNTPDCFALARHQFADQIKHFGYLESSADYHSVLQHADIVVSTAIHEFFGIAVVEAMGAGCIPVLPNRLSYPELIQGEQTFLYDGSDADLLTQFQHYAKIKTESPAVLEKQKRRAKQLAQKYGWPRVAMSIDAAVENLVETSSTNDDF